MSKPTGRPPGRPKGSGPTPSTRIGRGAGYGGPAKGEGRKELFAAGDEFRGTRTSAAIQAKIANREEVLEFYTEIIRDGGEATLNRISAGDKLLDRIEGKPTVGKPDDNGQQVHRIGYTWGDNSE